MVTELRYAEGTYFTQGVGGFLIPKESQLKGVERERRRKRRREGTFNIHLYLILRAVCSSESKQLAGGT
jgi:hypothetical protein